MKRSTILSIGLLISFFLPWIDFTILTLNGYEIPLSLDKLSNLNKLLNKKDDLDIYKLSYFFYLIPICSVYNIIKDFSAIKGSYFLNEFGIGILSIILLYVGVTNINEKATSVFSIGYYLTGLFSILGFLLNNRTKETENNSLASENENVEINISDSDKTNLLNQLSQLHSLKEKGVLTEEIYEQERKEILSKLKKENISENTVQTEVAEQSISPLDEYNPEYEELFGKQTWLSRNKIWVIIISILSAFIIIIYFISINSKSVEKLIIGKWEIDSIYAKNETVTKLEYLRTMEEFNGLKMSFDESKNFEFYKTEKEKIPMKYLLNNTFDTLTIISDRQESIWTIEKVDENELILNGPDPNFNQSWIFKKID